MSTPWTYKEAFTRNLGLITPSEQDKLRSSRVAILGMGGVGGVEAVTLARLGIGKFTLADPDVFSVANFNRQYGATVSALGQSKSVVMENRLKDINPELDIRVINDPIGPSNADRFLDGADLFVDGVDAFQINARRTVHHLAREKGIYAIIAGPLGLSTAFLTFDPNGMSFDRYFDIRDESTDAEKLAAFFAGLSPKITHFSYYDLSAIDIQSGAAPSVGLACELCAGVVGGETVKILLGRGKIKPAPYYHQFDVYKMSYKSGKLWFGNRGPLQLLKRHVLLSKIKQSLR